ncbi:hypothetical protein BD410DRAFT_806915 [Rickenella mellea]|uniref:Uncharacterized protein n=1 Tax=Rickenella mellea TaxID=50990 RepID=A0A4Y7PR42_9AGAM|nr:hypothetical protein BD410DRAFT_806915 [Rickenella mellea]
MCIYLIKRKPWTPQRVQEYADKWDGNLPGRRRGPKSKKKRVLPGRLIPWVGDFVQLDASIEMIYVTCRAAKKGGRPFSGSEKTLMISYHLIPVIIQLFLPDIGDFLVPIMQPYHHSANMLWDKFPELKPRSQK